MFKKKFYGPWELAHLMTDKICAGCMLAGRGLHTLKWYLLPARERGRTAFLQPLCPTSKESLWFHNIFMWYLILAMTYLLLLPFKSPTTHFLLIVNI